MIDGDPVKNKIRSDGIREYAVVISSPDSGSKWMQISADWDPLTICSKEEFDTLMEVLRERGEQLGWSEKESHAVKEVGGWCLARDEEVKITYPAGETGALFTCSLCGVTEKSEDLMHVLAPSDALLERLQKMQLQNRRRNKHEK